MAKPFLSNDFLLENDVSVQLYEQYAAPMPIIDYHNHLSPKEIAENRKFQNISEPWLQGDHYKWRAMRTNGVAEKFCTGDASAFEKFNAWAKTVPYTLRNPLYHWTHLELKNYFGIDKVLDETTAREIFDECSAMLQQEDFRVQGLLSKMKVSVVCTTDDPTDSLEYHRQFAGQSTEIKMYPSFRPDKAYATEDLVSYNQYIDKLSEVSKISIRNFDDLISALTARVDFFKDHGCRAADHGLDYLYFDDTALTKAPGIFQKVRDGKILTLEERLQFRCAVLLCLAQYGHSFLQRAAFHESGAQ